MTLAYISNPCITQNPLQSISLIDHQSSVISHRLLAISYCYIASMVNIPGRSDGCRTCLDRHIGCGELHLNSFKAFLLPSNHQIKTDEEQPTCGNCHRTGRVCGGYRGLSFVPYDPNGQRNNPNNNNNTNTRQPPTYPPEDVEAEGFVMVNLDPTSHAESSLGNATRLNHTAITPVIKRPPRGRPRKSSQEKSLSAKARRNTNDHTVTAAARRNTVPRPVNTVAGWNPVPQPVSAAPEWNPVLQPVNTVAGWNPVPQPVSAAAEWNPVPQPVSAAAEWSPVLQSELSLVAFQKPICVTFLVQNFLGHLDTGKKSLLPAWDVDNVSGTPRHSVNALALAFFGKAHHRQEIISQGAEYYGKALLQLRNDLNDKNAMYTPSVLLSSILLARYELVSSTGSHGWIQHAGGVERLFELRGPRRHRSLEERHIFEAARPIIAIKAITDCKRTFLEEPHWLHDPWAQDPNQKSPMNRLIDIFCVIPGLLESSKSLHSSKSFVWDFTTPTLSSTGSPAVGQDHRLVNLRNRTTEWYGRLQRWKEDWDRSYPSAVQPVNISYFPRSDLKFPEDIFGDAFTFINFLRANEYQLYNTVVFFLSSLMLSVPPPPDELGASPSVSDLLSQRWEAGCDICRAVPYDLFEKHGGGGAYLLLFPLMTCLRLWGEGSEEAKWIKHVLAKIANKWGMEGERKYMAIA